MGHQRIPQLDHHVGMYTEIDCLKNPISRPLKIGLYSKEEIMWT